MKIRLKDTVKVIAGSDKGMTGEVTGIIKDKNRVTVSGVANRIRHVKMDNNGNGGLIKINKSINVSNVAFFDKAKKDISKISIVREGKKTKRVMKKFNKEIK